MDTRKRKAPMPDNEQRPTTSCCDITSLPPEILSLILGRLSDRDFVACLFAARVFHLDDPTTYEARAKRWRGCTTAADFCRVGNVDALDRAWNCGDIDYDDVLELVPHAVAADQSDVLAWLCHRNARCASHAVECMVGPRVLAFLIRFSPDSVRTAADRIIERAIRKGLVDVVRLLDETHLVDLPAGSLDMAASEARLDIVAYLQERRPETGSSDALGSAASNGDLEMVRFLCDRRDDGCDSMSVAWAARGGHVAIMDLLRRRYPDIRCPREAICWAAHEGHVDAVAWLHGPNRAPCTPGLVSYCADSAVRAWLESNGCPCGTRLADADNDYGDHYFFEQLLDSESEGDWRYNNDRAEARIARRRPAD
ncbi:Ankyrin repeat domain containing protein [Pandoravirus salinus]|uniref:Ankyrin repeat domain containing protein n=1 Tax=Pandoravirus salinus TaxID=1349410 RepID=S4W3X4_9VIRU|nr:ankyrin repeat domain [Pandoravirus salinus]AGO85392.1 Ankyrin repeat domain containing protein [Pandoravirus salinus]